MTRLQLGISTCPNDTFAFHAILNRKIDLQGLEFDVQLLDVQELNERLFQGEFDVAKASFHAAVLLADQLGVLPAGSALGFGVGPLLLAARPGERPRSYHESSSDAGSDYRVLCPGQHTTAHLLYRLFYNTGDVRQAVFSEIMPALLQQTADFGVCIHEGRFTWQQQGLALVEDLGQRWETETSAPLPLGGILARHALGASIHRKLAHVIRQSIEYGLANRDETLPTLRRYAQEFNDEVLMAHVDLYVNQWTLDLGTEGLRALDLLSALAAEAGVAESTGAKLRIVGEN